MPIRSAHCFGFPTITIDSRPVKIERRKSMALLVYLLVEAGAAGASRTQMAEMLWPGMNLAEASWSLNNSLWDLGEALGETAIQADDSRLWLGEPFYVDVLAFETLAAAHGDPPIITVDSDEQL